MLAEDLEIAPGSVVGGYHAHLDEADPALLLARLVESHGRVHVAFPRVVALRTAALEFHRVPDGEVLHARRLLACPSRWSIGPPSRPSVLLVPLLAFDAEGYRLGYGGGFYDRTLAAINARAIGIAFAGQEVTALPREPHDRALDAVLTENRPAPLSPRDEG